MESKCKWSAHDELDYPMPPFDEEAVEQPRKLPGLLQAPLPSLGDKLASSGGDPDDSQNAPLSPKDTDSDKRRKSARRRTQRDDIRRQNDEDGAFSDALDRRLANLRRQLIADHKRYVDDREFKKLVEENKQLRQKLAGGHPLAPARSSIDSLNSALNGRRSLLGAERRGEKRRPTFQEPITLAVPKRDSGEEIREAFAPANRGPLEIEVDSPKVRPHRGQNADVTWEDWKDPADATEQDGRAMGRQRSDGSTAPSCSNYASEESESRIPMESEAISEVDESSQLREYARISSRQPSAVFVTDELMDWTGNSNAVAACKALMDLFGDYEWVNLGVVFSTWRDFVQKVKLGEVHNDDDEINERRIAALALWPPLDVIRTSTSDTFSKSNSLAATTRLNTRNSNITGDFMIEHSSLLQKLVAPPNSKKRMIWDTTGFALVGWDVFMIPMYAFDLGEAPAVVTMGFMTTLFWTIDFPTNFFVAFYSEGIVEMRPSKVAYHYLRTWCAIDIIVILLDWAFIALGLNDTGQASRWARLRINRLSRAFRFLRVLRLLRAAKLLPRIQAMFNTIQSDLWRLTFSVLRSVLIIVAINHMVACGWYTIGKYNDEDDSTWLAHAAMSDSDPEAWKKTWEYRYTTSLHWSFCQFTPASVDVNPRNLRERVFAVIIIVCGMVTFSSFVSSITSALTQLGNLKAAKHQEEMLMKQYFNENRVSVDLGKCVMDWLHANRRQQIFRVHEIDLPSFQDLPERLKYQLHLEVFEPILTIHPFFDTFQVLDSRGLHKICHRALSQHRLLTEQELFSRGQRTNKMYFIIVGECHFSSSSVRGVDSTYTSLTAGTWCCEVALWIPWIHLGSLTAATISELVAVDAATFQQTFPQCSKMVKRFVRAYASLFVRHDCDLAMEGQPWITDICCSPHHICGLCYQAREWVSCNFGYGVGPRVHVSASEDHKKGGNDFQAFASWLGIASGARQSSKDRQESKDRQDKHGTEKRGDHWYTKRLDHDGLPMDSAVSQQSTLSSSS